MAKKRETQVTSLNPASECIQSLVKQADVKAQLLSIQKYIQQLEIAPQVEQQWADIDKTLARLEEQPLSKLQLTRLTPPSKDYSFTEFYAEFEKILLPIIQITSESRLLIDPYCKLETDYSSRVNHYKKWLLNVLSIYLGYFSQDIRQQPQVLTDYLDFINCIYKGVTSSRVTLRQNPQVQSDALLELPRNTSLQVFAKLLNTHWMKVIVNNGTDHLEGYVQSAYIKIDQAFKLET